MFLKDLYRYRPRDNKESREDFLSSCLAELMRRDPAACLAVLHTVQLAGADLDLGRGYAVRTQVGRPEGTKMRWCDVMVELPGTAPLLIECKVGDQPKPEQVKLYQRLWNTKRVALLAPVATLPEPTSKPWIGIPRGSWQRVWEAIEALPPSEAHDSFRRAVLDLMTHLDLAGCPRRSRQDLIEAQAAWAAQEPLRAPMRRAVLALLKQGVIDLEEDTEVDENAGKTQPEWGDGRPLNAYWEREAARDGTKLLGLGLEVREREGVGTDDVDWLLSLYPSATLKPKLDKLVAADHGWTPYFGWFERPLGDTGGPDTPFGEQIGRAVKEARFWLGQLLPRDRVGRGRVVVSVPDGSGAEVSRHLARSEGWDAAMSAWNKRLMLHVREHLGRRVASPCSVRAVNDGVRVFRGKQELLWFGWEWDIEQAPYWELHMGWETVAAREQGIAATASVQIPDGVRPVLSGKYAVAYRVALDEVDGLEQAYGLLTETADLLVDHADGAALRQVGARP